MAWTDELGKRKTEEYRALQSFLVREAYEKGVIKRKRLPYGEAAFNYVYRNYKRNAKNRGLSFKLSRNEFRQLTQQNCRYCGIEPYNRATGTRKDTRKRFYGDYIYNGIDRVDASCGYNIENCVPCCKKCNRAKDTMSEDEFFHWVKTVFKHLHGGQN